VLHLKAGQQADPEACWRRILTLRRPDLFCSVDRGIYGHLTLRNLAVLAKERGDQAEARRLWKMVFDACPGRCLCHGAGKSSCAESICLPSIASAPRACALARKVLHDAARPAPKKEMPLNHANPNKRPIAAPRTRRVTRSAHSLVRLRQAVNQTAASQ
jgi:hypothetical protein